VTLDEERHLMKRDDEGRHLKKKKMVNIGHHLSFVCSAYARGEGEDAAGDEVAIREYLNLPRNAHG